MAEGLPEVSDLFPKATILPSSWAAHEAYIESVKALPAPKIFSVSYSRPRKFLMRIFQPKKLREAERACEMMNWFNDKIVTPKVEEKLRDYMMHGTPL